MARLRNELMLPYVRGKRVLDLGCVDTRPDGERKYMSTGLHLFLKEVAAELVGADLDEQGVREMGTIGLNVVHANAETMSLGRTFDTVVAGNLIEHLNNAGSFVGRAAEHLVEGGHLVLTTGNAFYIGNMYRILKKRRVDVHGEHTCWYDPITLEQLVTRYPFEVVDVRFTSKDRWHKAGKQFRPKYLIPRILTVLRPYFAGSFLLIARKVSKPGQTPLDRPYASSAVTNP